MPVQIKQYYLDSHKPKKHYNGYLERQMKLLAASHDATFRYSRKGVPHLVKLGEHQAYSIGLFVATKIWRVFFPYGEGGSQERRDFDSSEEAFLFIQEKEKELHDTT